MLESCAPSIIMCCYILWMESSNKAIKKRLKFHELIQIFHPIYRACQVCTPNATNTVWSHCQCVLADGVERGILTVNRMIPGPSIQVCEGDRVVVDVENHMEGMETTIHWHGIWQRGTQYYDGVPFVTQCPIQQGNTFRLVVFNSIILASITCISYYPL